MIIELAKDYAGKNDLSSVILLKKGDKKPESRENEYWITLNDDGSLPFDCTNTSVGVTGPLFRLFRGEFLSKCVRVHMDEEDRRGVPAIYDYLLRYADFKDVSDLAATNLTTREYKNVTLSVFTDMDRIIALGKHDQYRDASCKSMLAGFNGKSIGFDGVIVTIVEGGSALRFNEQVYDFIEGEFSPRILPLYERVDELSVVSRYVHPNGEVDELMVTLSADTENAMIQGVGDLSLESYSSMVKSLHEYHALEYQVGSGLSIVIPKESKVSFIHT